MKIRIRDWDLHFESGRTRQYQTLKWVPVPTKQGIGYKKIMHSKNGPAIYGCWCAIVSQAAKSDPRGDLTKYSIEDIAMLTMIDIKLLKDAILFLSQDIDWIEVVENKKNSCTDAVQIGTDDVQTATQVASVLSNVMLSNSIQSSSKEGVQGEKKRTGFTRPSFEDVTAYCKERNNGIDPQQWIDYYQSNGWKVGKNAMKDWKAAVRTWERNGIQRNTKNTTGNAYRQERAFKEYSEQIEAPNFMTREDM